jgi:hypothetical protein
MACEVRVVRLQLAEDRDRARGGQTCAESPHLLERDLDVLASRLREHSHEVHGLRDHASISLGGGAGQSAGRNPFLHGQERGRLAGNGPKVRRTSSPGSGHGNQRHEGAGQSGETPHTDHPADSAVLPAQTPSPGPSFTQA